jgi:parallel beta-helix repeat protein
MLNFSFIKDIMVHMSSIFRYLFRTTFFIFALFSFVNFADATTYYVDATGGSNTNNGTSEVTAWQTVSKAVGFALMPGDIVLFKKGETFNGTLTMNRSGSAGNLITFGTYGTGANPVINSGASYAVDIQNRSYLRFENLSIQGASTGQALVYGTISDIQFDGVSFTGGSYNVYVLSGTQTGLSFNNCTFSNSTTVGLSLSAGTVNFSLTNSTFIGGVIGLQIDSSNTNNITVSNTTFSSHSSYGLSSATGSNIITGTFDDLTVSGNSGAGMFFQGSASNMSLTDSTFSSNAGGIKIEPSTSKVVSNLTLSNLNTSSNAGIGISLGGAGSGSGVVGSNITSNSNTPGGGGIRISRTW